MAQSLMLKKENGAIAGYVLVSGGKLHYMCRGNGENGTLTLLYEEGERQKIGVLCDALEGHCAAEQGELLGAYVLVDAVVYASSSPWAAKEAEKQQDFIKKEEKRKEECKKKQSQSVLIEEKEPPCEITARDMQMRWPPPPCWPSARYVSGAWVESE